MKSSIGVPRQRAGKSPGFSIGLSRVLNLIERVALKSSGSSLTVAFQVFSAAGIIIVHRRYSHELEQAPSPCNFFFTGKLYPVW